MTGDWWLLILLTVFSFLDTFGRFMVKYRCGLTASNIWVPILLRVLCIPCMLMAQQGCAPFNHDFWSMFFTIILGFTNGYIGSLSPLFIIELVEEEEAGYAGSLTSFFLNAGLVLGSTI